MQRRDFYEWKSKWKCPMFISILDHSFCRIFYDNWVVSASGSRWSTVCSVCKWKDGPGSPRWTTVQCCPFNKKNSPHCIPWQSWFYWPSNSVPLANEQTNWYTERQLALRLSDILSIRLLGVPLTPLLFILLRYPLSVEPSQLPDKDRDQDPSSVTDTQTHTHKKSWLLSPCPRPISSSHCTS